MWSQERRAAAIGEYVGRVVVLGRNHGGGTYFAEEFVR